MKKSFSTIMRWCKMCWLLWRYRKVLRKCAEIGRGEAATRVDRAMLNELTMEEQFGVEDMERLYRIFHISTKELNTDLKHLKKVLGI